MKTKSFNILCLLFFFFSIFPKTTFGADYPSADLFLYNGRLHTIGDLAASEMINKLFFAGSSIDVKNGKVSANITRPIETSKGNQTFTGTVSLKMNGDYYQDDGSMNGSFSFTQNTNSVYEFGKQRTEGNWTNSYSGTFQGQIIHEKAMVLFKGTMNEELNIQSADLSWEKSSSSVKKSDKVAYQIGFYAKEEKKEEKPGIDKEFLSAEGKIQDSGARPSGISGQVEYHIPGEPEDEWHSMKMDTVIPVGARIKTDDDSSVILSFGDMSTYVLRANSEIIMTTPPEKNSNGERGKIGQGR